MAEKHIQAQKDYVKIQGACRKVGVSVNTIKSWIQRHSWERKKGAPIQTYTHKLLDSSK